MPMKIIYCIASTRNSGGMERVLSNKANYLAKAGYEVIIITTDQRGEEPFFPLDERICCYDLGVNYEGNNGKSFINKLVYYPFKKWKHLRRLRVLLVSLKADIVISMFCNEASLMSRINDGSKKILEVHFSKFKRLQYARKGMWRLADWYRSKCDEKMIRGFDRFVVLTKEDRKYWGLLPNIEVIPNMLSFIVEEPASLDGKNVIAIGRYTHQKGFDFLIEAWSTIYQKRPEWKLDIVGSGELERQLQSRIERNGLSKCVTLKSPTRRIEEAYKKASILVLTSRYEGLPMVLLEAESYGIPVVAFACKCGPKDIIKDGQDGFLVPEGNLEVLSERLLALMDDELMRKRMGKAAKLNSKRFSKKVVMGKWERLFENLIHEVC